MSSVIELFFGGRYNAWNENYPNATGPYWDGIAAVWDKVQLIPDLLQCIRSQRKLIMRN